MAKHLSNRILYIDIYIVLGLIVCMLCVLQCMKEEEDIFLPMRMPSLSGDEDHPYPPSTLHIIMQVSLSTHLGLLPLNFLFTSI